MKTFLLFMCMDDCPRTRNKDRETSCSIVVERHQRRMEFNFAEAPWDVVKLWPLIMIAAACCRAS